MIQRQAKTDEEKRLAKIESYRKYMMNQRRQTYMKVVEDCSSKEEMVDAFLNFFAKKGSKNSQIQTVI